MSSNWSGASPVQAPRVAWQAGLWARTRHIGLLPWFLVVALLLAGCSASTNRLKAYNTYAIEAAYHGLWREAALRWEQARDLDPSNPRIWNNLGVAYEANGDFDRAIEAYRRAVALDPTNGHYVRNLRRGERNEERSKQVTVPPIDPDEDEDLPRIDETLPDESSPPEEDAPWVGP